MLDKELKRKIESLGVVTEDKMFIKYSNDGILDLVELIQEERKNAVRGFVDTIEWEKIDGVDDDDTIRGRNLVEQMETYLQSLDKGDKE